MTSLIRFQEASLELGRFTLQIGTINIEPGITLITGPNGSGKSTLLRAILALQQLSAGERIAKQELSCGYLPQNYRDSLIPWLTGWQNLNLIGRVSHQSVRWLRRLGFQTSDFRKYPAQLSGGQCQRLALLREWAAKPDVLVLDEPFSGLDHKSTGEVMRLLAQVADHHAIVLSTHVLAESFAPSGIISRFLLERPRDDWAVVVKEK